MIGPEDDACDSITTEKDLPGRLFGPDEKPPGSVIGTDRQIAEKRGAFLEHWHTIRDLLNLT